MAEYEGGGVESSGPDVRLGSLRWKIIYEGLERADKQLKQINDKLREGGYLTKQYGKGIFGRGAGGAGGAGGGGLGRALGIGGAVAGGLGAAYTAKKFADVSGISGALKHGLDAFAGTMAQFFSPIIEPAMDFMYNKGIPFMQSHPALAGLGAFGLGGGLKGMFGKKGLRNRARGFGRGAITGAGVFAGATALRDIAAGDYGRAAATLGGGAIGATIGALSTRRAMGSYASHATPRSMRRGMAGRGGRGALAGMAAGLLGYAGADALGVGGGRGGGGALNGGIMAPVTNIINNSVSAIGPTARGFMEGTENMMSYAIGGQWY